MGKCPGKLCLQPGLSLATRSQPFPTAMVRFTTTPSADEWGHLRAQAALPSSLAGQEEPPHRTSWVKCPLWGYERQGYVSSLFCPAPSRMGEWGSRWQPPPQCQPNGFQIHIWGPHPSEGAENKAL